MCIFFNMYDTLGEILYRTIDRKFRAFRDAKLKKFEKSNTFLLYSYFFLYTYMLKKIHISTRYENATLCIILARFVSGKNQIFFVIVI